MRERGGGGWKWLEGGGGGREGGSEEALLTDWSRRIDGRSCMPVRLCCWAVTGDTDG